MSTSELSCRVCIAKAWWRTGCSMWWRSDDKCDSQVFGFEAAGKIPVPFTEVRESEGRTIIKGENQGFTLDGV